MPTTCLSRILLVVLLACILQPAVAHERTAARIRHAEPIALTAAMLPSEASLVASGGRVRVRFEAFGRPFELELESNAPVLGNLPAAERGALPPHALYKGRLAGIPDSWLRITNVDGSVYGAVSDGTGIYAIAPARVIQGLLEGSVPGGAGATLIYRASDVDSGLAPGFCGAVVPQATATGEVQYDALLQELTVPATAAALAATQQLAIGLVADVQFAQRFIDPQGVMLSRLNTADGILSAQVGVSIVATELRVLDSNGGLTATGASTLLKQLSTLRASTPDLRSHGLTHLMTGRDLDGTTAGIAYIGSICSKSFGASLSQQGSDPWTGALVTAHEIGHNFGALHDGETGTPCATTPRTFLMAPSINGSATFSQCSLDTIAPTVQEASCLSSTGFVDLGLEGPAGGVSGLAGEPELVSVDLVSLGSLDSASVAVTLATDSSLQVLEASAASGTCATAPGAVACDLGPVAAGERRRIELKVQGNPGQYTISASLAAPFDQNPANNSTLVSLALTAAADGALTMAPATLSATERQVQRASVQLTTSGTEPLAGVAVRVSVPADVLAVVSATADQGSCTESAGTITCNLGDVAPGTARRVDLDLRGIRSATTTIEATLTAANDVDARNDRASATVSIAAAASTGSVGGGGGGGKGGGGATDAVLLAVLLALLRNRYAALARRGPLTQP